MQILGVASLLGGVVCILLLFAGEILIAKISFSISLILLISSLMLSLKEISMSIHALNLELSDLEKDDLEILNKD
jgi:hypothetical protein